MFFRLTLNCRSDALRNVCAIITELFIHVFHQKIPPAFMFVKFLVFRVSDLLSPTGNRDGSSLKSSSLLKQLFAESDLQSFSPQKFPTIPYK